MDSTVAVAVRGKSQLCPAAVKQRERGNMVHLPGGRVDAPQPRV